MPRILKKKEVDQTVLELGRERVAHAFDKFDHVSVFFSGGKDSTVCLNLALEEARKRGRLPLDVVFFDEEAQAPETIEYMQRVNELPEVSLRWLCLPVKHRNACSRRSPYWHPWAPEDEAKWCRSLPASAITQLDGFDRRSIPECNPLLYPSALGQVAIIVGIRAAESVRRFQSVSCRVYENYIAQVDNAPHAYLVKPIYDWTTDDVWSAPRQLGWDWNRAYDVMTRAGISRHVQRVCPPYGEEPLRALWMYAVCWPELWTKMQERVPGAATGGRYCRSPLFGFGDVSGPPEGVSWSQFIAVALSKWSPEIARAIASRIRNMIALHNQSTGGAPLTEELDPISGIGWKMLYMIALRGDLKGRRNRKFTGAKRESDGPQEEGHEARGTADCTGAVARPEAAPGE